MFVFFQPTPPLSPSHSVTSEGSISRPPLSRMPSAASTGGWVATPEWVSVFFDLFVCCLTPDPATTRLIGLFLSDIFID